jgi:hypothetical protein
MYVFTVESSWCAPFRSIPLGATSDWEWPGKKEVAWAEEGSGGTGHSNSGSCPDLINICFAGSCNKAVMTCASRLDILSSLTMR